MSTPEADPSTQHAVFLSAGRKLTTLTGVAVALGFIAVVWFYAYQHERNILRQNERTLHQVTESVVQGLETVMLTGHADVAESFAERLKAVEDVTDFRILRTNGQESFLDNETIYRVNEIRGDEDFLPRADEKQVAVLPPDDSRLVESLQSKRPVLYYDGRGRSSALTVLWPILNGKDCTKCHGKQHEVRGVLKLTTSMAPVHNEVARLRWQAALVLAAAVLIVIVVMTVMLRRTVVDPIRQVSSAMRRVSGGDLSQAVPVLGNDELADMAISFNRMLDELRETYTGFRNERDKLETIIGSSRDGIVVTDDSAVVVLVNPAAEQLLGKAASTIVAAGFEALVDQPALIRRLLAEEDRRTETVLYGERYLAISVAAIRNDDGRLVGQTALIRDISEEKRLQDMLRAMSHTDGLTGLGNRRMLDEALLVEVARASQTGRALSLLMFDVDHFKQFNDRYGHAQGDRVLQAVAAAARDSIRNIDLACRYGGEEFVLILSETPLDGAVAVAERFRESVESMRVDGLHVTVSIGVAGWQESAPVDATTFLELADRALYAAKRAGRNRVCAASTHGEKA